ncbi:low molecular weight protein arginine phosphatase [Alicyclobacillus dauci]|uniref:Low molecular weight protein arginine phosphatase n=1 Tax=Alicyclobacillus dauci TaxID=1475485 RepID=A0ABY6Z204_9BACL|nr:low molecular weight protein arginine phosphatase [Alicyclobacillus dauci]WAH36872.1 low molecular weight protein arginine phosphatase [Alicyclobacillus dauci]
MHILFVCTGNTCRSPMASALARHHVAAHGLNWTVDSAGIYAVPGQPMAAYATDALIRRHVLVPNHQSQPVTPELIEQADLIFAMTRSHKADLLRKFAEAHGKVFTLAEFVEGESAAADVTDPFGGSPEVYEACAEALDATIQKLISRLKEQRDQAD